MRRERAATELPLAGLRIVDCTRLLPVAYGTQLLATLGAEVIKVEAPAGEYGRQLEETFEMSNRGKRSVTINLKDPRGVDLLKRLATTADALVESFRPGTMDSFGVGADVLLGLRPALVYCSVSGYGQKGAHRLRPGHDLNYLALAGAVEPTAGAGAYMAPFPVADMAVGLWAFGSILAALRAAEATGRGEHLDIAMSDLAFSMNVLAIAQGADVVHPGTQDTASAAGELGGYPWPQLALGETPCYGAFQTSDGRTITLCNVEPKFWRRFLDVIGRPDLEAQRFATGDRADIVRAEIQSIVGAQSLEHWESTFGQDSEVCYAPARTVAEAARDPHFADRGVVRWEADEATMMPPVVFALGGSAPMPDPAPTVGEHNESVFGALGYAADELSSLTADGVI